MILVSWGIVFFEYGLLVPANRAGYRGSPWPSARPRQRRDESISRRAVASGKREHDRPLHGGIAHHHGMEAVLAGEPEEGGTEFSRLSLDDVTTQHRAGRVQHEHEHASSFNCNPLPAGAALPGVAWFVLEYRPS